MMKKTHSSTKWIAEQGIPTNLHDKNGKPIHINDRLKDFVTGRIFTLINEADEWNIVLILVKDMRWNDPADSFVKLATQEIVGKMLLVEDDSEDSAVNCWDSQKEFLSYCKSWKS